METSSRQPPPAPPPPGGSTVAARGRSRERRRQQPVVMPEPPPNAITPEEIMDALDLPIPEAEASMESEPSRSRSDRHAAARAESPAPTHPYPSSRATSAASAASTIPYGDPEQELPSQIPVTSEPQLPLQEVAAQDDDDDPDDEDPPTAAAAAARDGKRSPTGSAGGHPKKSKRDDENYWWDHLHPSLIRTWIRTDWAEVYTSRNYEAKSEVTEKERTPARDSWMVKDGYIGRVHRQARRAPLRRVSTAGAPATLSECTWQTTFCKLSETVYQCAEVLDLRTGLGDTRIPAEAWTGVTIYSKRHLPYAVGQRCEPFSKEARTEMSQCSRQVPHTPASHHCSQQFEAVDTAYICNRLHTHPYTLSPSPS
eukprot:767947-Amphidinium_carterae.1